MRCSTHPTLAQLPAAALQRRCTGPATGAAPHVGADLHTEVSPMQHHSCAHRQLPPRRVYGNVHKCVNSAVWWWPWHCYRRPWESSTPKCCCRSCMFFLVIAMPAWAAAVARPTRWGQAPPAQAAVKAWAGASCYLSGVKLGNLFSVSTSTQLATAEQACCSLPGTAGAAQPTGRHHPLARTP